jgi:hypothetical protein
LILIVNANHLQKQWTGLTNSRRGKVSIGIIDRIDTKGVEEAFESQAIGSRFAVNLATR